MKFITNPSKSPEPHYALVLGVFCVGSSPSRASSRLDCPNEESCFETFCPNHPLSTADGSSTTPLEGDT
jgi:hypothetical protein